MQRFSRSHLSDQGLVSSLAANAGRERAATAEFLADIAEFDARKLFLPAGYDSMFAYCVGELHLSDDAAYKRIKAARAARRFPAIFAAVADGRLHLSAVVLLAPYLVEDTAVGLLAAATHKTKSEVERLVAERFPRPDVPAWVHAIATASSPTAPVQQAPGPVEPLSSITSAPAPVAEGQAPMLVHAPSAAAPVDDPARVKPLAPGRFAVRFTMGQSAHDKLRYVQELLSHELPSGDLEQVFEQALDALIPELEKRKFAATSSPRRAPRRPTKSLRHIPADVMRAVWERDGGQCTFLSESGHRCQARKFIEFDHVQEVGRGGEASIDGIRLLCHAHNQHQAERTFGAEFMRHKRIAARKARVGTKARTTAARAKASCGEQPAVAG